MQKIIFLDIDGPIIPTPMYFNDRSCALNFSQASNIAIACLNHLCEKSGAKIVTNTFHNTRKNPSVHEGLVEHGLNKDFLFSFNSSSGKTGFPVDSLTPNRMNSISIWIEDFGPCDWLCFDDSNFTEDKRLILVDFDLGITYKEYRKASNLWGIKETLVI
jgi:hypothetical protein